MLEYTSFFFWLGFAFLAVVALAIADEILTPNRSRPNVKTPTSSLRVKQMPTSTRLRRSTGAGGQLASSSTRRRYQTRSAGALSVKSSCRAAYLKRRYWRKRKITLKQWRSLRKWKRETESRKPIWKSLPPLSLSMDDMDWSL